MANVNEFETIIDFTIVSSKLINVGVVMLFKKVLLIAIRNEKLLNCPIIIIDSRIK